MSTTPKHLRQELAALLAREGALTDPGWGRAVEAVPNARFLGEAVFHQDASMAGDHWHSLRRSHLPKEKWWEMAYSDKTWITQVDGIPAEAAGTTVVGAPTSSSTMPSMVVMMLERAGISDGDKVLEIGTGTGYSTALLCERLGDGQVTSVEYDRHAALRARLALEDSGYAPTLVVGDGLAGYDKNAQYDRLIATCSVRYIPMAWMEQVRDGGTITAPCPDGCRATRWLTSPWPTTAPRAAGSCPTTSPSCPPAPCPPATVVVRDRARHRAGEQDRPEHAG